VAPQLRSREAIKSQNPHREHKRDFDADGSVKRDFNAENIACEAVIVVQDTLDQNIINISMIAIYVILEYTEKNGLFYTG